MAPFFTIFCDKESTPEQTEIVQTLEKYYLCFIDSENTAPLIKKKYKTSNHKFFGKDLGDWLMYEVDIVDCIPPAFVLTFDVGEKIKKDQWMQAFDFVKTIFSETPDQTIIEKMKELVPVAPIAEKLTIAPRKDAVKQNNEYMFEHYIDAETDTCYCQIEKPFTDKPYTCVIEEFSKNDFLPMFTAFFICQSWGVSPKDHIFLAHLWRHLDMQKNHGKLDLEKRLRQNIQQCQDGMPEPRVYRDYIQDVIELFKIKKVVKKE
jgi:hypothetical protein